MAPLKPSAAACRRNFNWVNNGSVSSKRQADEGATVKIEPMTVDRIKKEVAWALRIRRESEHVDYKTVLPLAVGILEWAYTWAHAEAGRRMIKYRLNYYEGMSQAEYEAHHLWTHEQWLAKVLAEIGWQ